MNDPRARLRALMSGQHDRDRATLIGLAVTAVWLLLVLLFWLLGPDAGAAPSGLARLMAVAGVVMPLVLTWIAVGIARALADLRAEAMLLRGQVEAMRASGRDDTPAAAANPGLAASMRGAAPRARADRQADRQAEARQPALPLDAPEPVEIAPELLIPALNFPDGPDDRQAVDALRQALSDAETARTIRAAQDIIMLMAKHGIYMDDLHPIAPAPEVWRRLAAQGRGKAATGLPGFDGGAEAEEGATALMRGDEVFRDAAHHFLRQFDRLLSRRADDLSDAGLLALGDTRSGRAFTLLTQATGA